MTALTAQLRAIRRERRVSILALSDRSGYDRFTISRWEREKAAPTLSRFVDWAAALGYEVKLVPQSETDRTKHAEMVTLSPH
jgi:transcriptional regulator with XRE-family HTH domain